MQINNIIPAIEHTNYKEVNMLNSTNLYFINIFFFFNFNIILNNSIFFIHILLKLLNPIIIFNIFYSSFISLY